MTLAQVKEFNETFGVAMSATPTTRVPAAGLRYELIREEFEELATAVTELDIVEIADALGDIEYVTDGAALVFGVSDQLEDVASATYYNPLIISSVQDVLDDLRTNILWNNTKRTAKTLSRIHRMVKDVAEWFDIDLEAVVDAIHTSNMSKLGEDGKPIYREGDRKVLKGPNYKTPTDDIRKIVFGDNYAPAGV